MPSAIQIATLSFVQHVGLRCHSSGKLVSDRSSNR